MTSNNKTIETYERNIAKFIERTPKDTIGETKIWLDALAERVTTDSSVLEIGSGFGRDAEYLTSKGISVLCTDGAAGFVKALRARGHEARQLNVVTDEIDGDYDLIFADAVFEHFTRDQLAVVLSKLNSATVEGGSLGFSIRRGDGEHWSTEKLDEDRFFCLWQPDQLDVALTAAGYAVDSIAESTGYQDIERLYLIATKQ